MDHSMMGSKNDGKKKLNLRIDVDDIPATEDGEWRKERIKRNESSIRFLERHPALNDDKIALALARNAIKKKIQLRKAEMMMDQARDDVMHDMGESEPPKAKSKPQKMDPVRKRPMRH